MRILHTADWHIGQLFYEYDRTYEHQHFLNWLVVTLKDEKIDVLLVSGDIFDLSNPSAASIRMFYTFLNLATKDNPNLQIILISGNHDSATRLESPKPLLESSNIHIVGIVEKDQAGNIDYEKLSIPIKDNTGIIKAWCLAIPFLRIGDYPVITDAANQYAEGVAALYDQAYDFINKKRLSNQPVICMGHLHAQKAEITDMDKSERLILGGIECISAATFNEEVKYVALGHIHKAQRIGGKDHIRYSGSPIPMSFSELKYKHQVVVFDLGEQNISNLKSIEIPLSVSLQIVPSVHSTLTEVINALQQLDEAGSNPELAPYLEVRVLLEGPEPGLRHKIESAIAGKHVRLAKIDVKYPVVSDKSNTTTGPVHDNLHDLKPKDIFEKIYQSKFDKPVPAEIIQLFNQVTQEVAQSETA